VQHNLGSVHHLGYTKYGTGTGGCLQTMVGTFCYTLDIPPSVTPWVYTTVGTHPGYTPLLVHTLGYTSLPWCISRVIPLSHGVYPGLCLSGPLVHLRVYFSGPLVHLRVYLRVCISQVYTSGCVYPRFILPGVFLPFWAHRSAPRGAF